MNELPGNFHVDYDPDREIHGDPDAHEAVTLPFLLLDGDGADEAARVLVSVPLLLPPEWLADLLYLASKPGGVADPHAPASDDQPADQPGGSGTGDQAARQTARLWRTCAEYLLLAGVEVLALRRALGAVETDRDADAFLRLLQHRDHVAAVLGTDPGPAGDQSSTG
jgi:hypothetical protein